MLNQRSTFIFPSPHQRQTNLHTMASAGFCLRQHNHWAKNHHRLIATNPTVRSTAYIAWCCKNSPNTTTNSCDGMAKNYTIPATQVRNLLIISIAKVGNDEYLTKTTPHIFHYINQNSPWDLQSRVQITGQQLPQMSPRVKSVQLKMSWWGKLIMHACHLHCPTSTKIHNNQMVVGEVAAADRTR